MFLSDSQVLKRGRASSSALVGIPATSGGAVYRCGPGIVDKDQFFAGYDYMYRTVIILGSVGRSIQG